MDITSYIRAGNATSGACDQHVQQSGVRPAQLLIPSADQLDDCVRTQTAHKIARKAAKEQRRKDRAAARSTAEKQKVKDKAVRVQSSSFNTLGSIQGGMIF